MFKNSKHEFFLMLTVVAALSFLIGSLFTNSTGAITSVNSLVTDNGPVAGFFEVPQGKIAKGFSAVVSNTAKGWGIYRAEMIDGVYVPKSYDPLYHTAFGGVSGFVLGPGKYIALVDGWSGAELTLYFSIE